MLKTTSNIFERKHAEDTLDAQSIPANANKIIDDINLVDSSYVGEGETLVVSSTNKKYTKVNGEIVADTVGVTSDELTSILSNYQMKS